MNDTAKPTLILTVGLPYSGKTTWALKKQCPVVSPDSVRLALHGERFVPLAEPMVWAITKIMVRALFLAGHKTVILDATNTTRKRREEWRSVEWDRDFLRRYVAVDECRRRAKEAGDTEILPVIDRMAEQFEEVGEDERDE